MDTGRKNRVVPENAWPGGLASLELHVNVARFTAALAAVGQGIRRASDIDHAVANEREAIAVWMGTPEVYDMWPHDMARLIRNGAHHANTPPNAQERGQE